MRDGPRLVGMAGVPGRDRRLDGFEDDPFSASWQGRGDGTVGGRGGSRGARGAPKVVRVEHVRPGRSSSSGDGSRGGVGHTPAANMSRTKP